MSHVVYWLTPSLEPACEVFASNALTSVLACVQRHRLAGMRHVSISSDALEPPTVLPSEPVPLASEAHSASASDARHVVYWLTPSSTVSFRAFEEAQHAEASRLAQALRQAGARHISISSQWSDSIGAPGVAAVEHGVLPDGHAYEWTKAHRGAGPAKS